MKNSMAGSKRKANLVFEYESAVSQLCKRAKTVPTSDMMVIGLVPMMTLAAPQLKYAPNQELVNQVKRIILAGTKTQKQVAKECGLSQTKMSQFMNLSPRVHGWDSVEAKVTAWLKKTKRSQRSGHPLESDYSVPQSCVVTHEQPEPEELRSTVYVQNRSNPWQFDDTSTSTTSTYAHESAEIEALNPIENNDQQHTIYSNSDEVINTSSDLSGVEISKAHLVHDATTNSGVREDFKPELASKWTVGTCTAYLNDCAWDNFSIVQALDSPL